MHICFITAEYPKEGFPHGGVGTFIQTISRHLVKTGIKVSVVGVNYVQKYEQDLDQGVDIYRVPFSRTKGAVWYFNSKRVNRKLKQLHSVSPIDVIETAELGLAFIKKYQM